VKNPEYPLPVGGCGFSTSKAYKKVFPKATHQALGKEAGETNHVERWNNSRLKIRKHVITNEQTGFSTSKPCVNAWRGLFARPFPSLNP
jgi:hypothetical protein